MKILSVAEDNLYNLWQLELQIYYFKKLGLEKNFVPIVIGRKEEPSEYAKKLSEKKQKIHFYKMGVVDFFSKSDYYPPAIQPFGVYEYLKDVNSTERIFIIDVDVILRNAEAFYNLEKLDPDIIWTSPTSYSRIDYYSAKGEPYSDSYDKMLNYLNLEKSKVENLENRYSTNKDDNPSGHTIIINDPDPIMFKKVTKDSIVIHELLKNHSKDVREHMSWMASVWAYYYNCILSNKALESSSYLNFCWAVSDPSCSLPLIHMAGAMKDNKEKVFSKLDFMSISPFNPEHKDKVNSYNENYAAKFYVDIIKEYWEENPVCL